MSPGSRAGNIGSRLCTTFPLVRQIPISLKGVNLISGKISTGEIKFHMANEAEFCVVIAGP